MTSSQLCWKGPGVLSSTNTQPCLHVTSVHQCNVLYGVVSWVWWCCGVVGAGEKKGRRKHTVKQKQKAGKGPGTVGKWVCPECRVTQVRISVGGSFLPKKLPDTVT